jgi:probable HAF family extracellular repeat protein
MHTHANERAPMRASKSSRRRRLAKVAVAALAAGLPVIGAAGVASPALAQSPASSHYQFRTLDNAADPTFNQLLGINQEGLIAGYFGSGAQGHPNQGYLLVARHGQQRYLSENVNGSVQTQVTGLNDRGITVGFWSSMNNPSVNGAPPVNDNRAFVAYRRHYFNGDFPTATPASPPVDQLLGVNDRDIAVGFYVDAAGNTHAYKLDIRRDAFTELTPTVVTGPTAAAINNRGEIAGFGTDATGDATNGKTVGYVLRRDGEETVLAVPGATMTQALGINDRDEVVGFYQTPDGNQHGFTWTPGDGFQTLVDDPNAATATTINGLNDEGQLVGFYTDANGNTHGLLATPQHH